MRQGGASGGFAARVVAGAPVVEGLLSLVHLDHAAHLLAPMPAERAELTVTATASAAYDTEVGRVVPVSVSITDADGTELARLEERRASSVGVAVFPPQ